MEIDIKTAVECGGSHCGSVTRIIINPATQMVAYCVVSAHMAPQHEVLVQTGMIGSIIPGHIRLQCTEEELSRFPRFLERDFIKMDMPGRPMPGYLMLPYVLPYKVSMLHKRMPENVLPVRRGARIQATDEAAGTLDAFLVDPSNGQITHIILRQEPQVVERHEVSIPVDAIERMNAHTIHLALDTEGLNLLPEIPHWPGFIQDEPGTWALIKMSVAASAQQIEDIAHLIVVLASRHGQKRLQARRMLVNIGKQAIPSLNGLLDKKKHQMRWEAAKSLAQIHDPDCTPGLLKALEDERFGIRWIAAEGIVALGMPAVKQLLKLLQKRPDSARLRKSARHVVRSVIGKAPSHELQPVLIELEKYGTVMASLPRSAKLALASYAKAQHESDALYEHT
jgi:hypothetical protein